MFMQSFKAFQLLKNKWQNNCTYKRTYIRTMLYRYILLFYLFCSSIVINTVIVTAGDFEP